MLSVVVLGREIDFPAPRGRSTTGPILLIEDDFAIRRSIAEILMGEGYEVASAANGREALNMLAEHRVRPGLIILDLLMPSMDGLQFRILQQSITSIASVPVLVITASRFLPRELESLGLTHVLRKPLDLHQLLTEITELIA
jgi:CheY-like chemotaxis protein